MPPSLSPAASTSCSSSERGSWGPLSVVALHTLFILLLGLCLPSNPVHADATPLSPAITTWYNVCGNCEVPMSGTTLNVQAMTGDAATNSEPNVVFTMTNLLTIGQLIIDCTSTPWSNNVPLLFKVINGMNTPTSATPLFFKITGTLSLGSTVEITGGTYFLEDRVVRFFEVNLQMSSTASIQIKSNTFIQQIVGSTPQMYLWSISLLTMASSSSIDHSDNTLSLDGAVSTTSYFEFVYMFIYSSCLQMSSGSSFLIKNNTFTAGTFSSVSGSFAILGIKFRLCGTRTYSSASLTISDNTFSFIGSTFNAYISSTWIASDTTDVTTLGSGAEWNLSNNKVLISNTTFGNTVSSKVFNFAGDVVVESITSKLSVTGMMVVIQNVSVIPDTLTIHAIYVGGTLTVRVLGILEVSDTQVLIENGMNIGNLMQVDLVRSATLLTPQGVVRLLRNTIISTAVVTSSSSTSTASIVKTTSPSNSTIVTFPINYNILDTVNETTVVALLAPGTVMAGFTNIDFTHNQLRGPTGRTYIATSGITFGRSPEVCNNTVYGDLCVVASKRRVTGLYSCIPTDTTPIPIVTDVCGKSNTYTDTLPITTTDSTLPTVTPTSLPTRTLTSTLLLPPTATSSSTPSTSKITPSPSRTSTPSAPTPTPGTHTPSPPTPSSTRSHSISRTAPTLSDRTTTPSPHTNTPSLSTVPTSTITISTSPSRQSATPTNPTPSDDTMTHSNTFRYIPPCTHTCNDIIAAFIVPPSSSSTTDAIVSAYWATYNQSAPRRGCGAVSVGFDATGNGRAVRVLIHVDTGSLTANASYPMLGLPVPATPTSTIRATSLSTNFSGGVVVLEVRRVDATPVTSVTGTITLPAGGFMCSSSGSGGLPTADILFNAPPPSLTAAEQQAVTVVSALSPDLQTVAAMSLLRCSPGDPIDVETEATIRALVPVALSGTCAGAVQGAMLAVVAVGLLCALATSILMKIRKVGWMEAAAVTRCPGVALGVWAFMQMGFVVCGARLVKSDSNGDVALGVVGILLAVILPVLCVVLAWKVVSRRCYRIGPTPEVIQSSSKVGLWLRSVLLPEYELDTVVYPVSKAYSTIVGRSRLVGSVWACVPMAQPIIMLVVVFVSGVGCSAVLIAAGVLMLLVAAVCQVWFRPHRIFASNILQAGSMSINATILIIGASLSSNPTHPTSLTAFRYVSMMQLGLSVIRLSHTALSAGYMLLRRGASFQRVDPSPQSAPPQPKNKNIPSSTDQSLLPPPLDDDGVTKVTPVFDYLPHPGAHPHQPATMDQQPPVSTLVPQQQQHYHYAPIPCPPNTTTPDDNITNTSPREEQEHPHHQDPSSSPLSSPNPQPSTEVGARPPLSAVQKVVSFFTTPKNTRNFNEDIVATMLNNHHGYIPMDRPYTLLYEEEEGGDGEEMSDQDDVGIDDDDPSSSTSTNRADNVYAHSGGGGSGRGVLLSEDMDDDLSVLPSRSSSSSSHHLPLLPLSSNSSRASL